MATPLDLIGVDQPAGSGMIGSADSRRCGARRGRADQVAVIQRRRLTRTCLERKLLKREELFIGPAQSHSMSLNPTIALVPRWSYDPCGGFCCRATAHACW